MRRLKLLIVPLLISGTAVFGSAQQQFDSDDGIHHPNSTRIYASAEAKARRDTGDSSPNAGQVRAAYDALAQKPGTLVYKSLHEK